MDCATEAGFLCWRQDKKLVRVGKTRSMIRRASGSPARPGWDRVPSESPTATFIGQRRWRILQHAQPLYPSGEPVPPWIRTPEQFIDWLSVRVAPDDLRAYFRDLEDIARQSCDLELLRFARRYMGGR
jgi:hypothetical protein